MEDFQITKKTYVEKWVEKKGKKQLPWWLGGISFAESSFFPIPVDPFLLVSTCLKPHRWIRYALIVSVASVLGGIFGYLIGFYFFDLFGKRIIDFYSLQEQFAYVGELFDQNAFWAVLISAFTPIPYKIFTIAGGFFKINLISFILASVIGRAARFFLVAFFAKLFGKTFGKFFLKFVDIIMIILVILLILYSLNSFI